MAAAAADQPSGGPGVRDGGASSTGGGGGARGSASPTQILQSNKSPRSRYVTDIFVLGEPNTRNAHKIFTRQNRKVLLTKCGPCKIYAAGLKTNKDWSLANLEEPT